MPASPEQVERGEGPAGGPPSQLGLGERLRSARKARAISLERVAESLHLDEAVILALEEERFEELGAPVFVRGHLKAYARLVGLPIDSVLGAYQQTEPHAVAAPSTERRVHRSVTINPMVWGVSALVLLLGVVLALYVMQDDDVAPATDAVVDPAPAGGAGAVAEPPTPESDAGVVSEIVIPAPAEREAPLSEPALAAVSDAAIEAAVEPRPDRVRLSLHFREESWVEISDANRRLLFGLQREGRRRELAGEPPIRILIGNAAGVDLSVNDEPYELPSSVVTGEVARFEIDATAFE